MTNLQSGLENSALEFILYKSSKHPVCVYRELISSQVDNDVRHEIECASSSFQGFYSSQILDAGAVLLKRVWAFRL